MFRQTFKLILLCFVTHLLSATQGTITGSIRDAQTREPLAYTNVFLANTTIGDAADKDGRFVLDFIPPGHYQLVFSRIGYEIQVHEVLVEPGQAKTMNVDMSVKSIEGEEVRVEAERNSREWRRHLRDFEREFIGTTANSGKCKILNPEVLSFHRDKYDLIATADQPIVVENKALGYRLDIILASFRWGLGNGQFIIYPKYTEVEPKNDRQLEKWHKERALVFHTSIRDFFATLYSENLFPRYGLVKLREESPGKFKSIVVDSINVESLNSTRDLKRYVNKNIMRVEHWTGNSSTIDFHFDYIDFDRWGNVYPPDGVRVSGYWGQFRVADSLPFDYHPKDSD